jgi:uncharacterized protein
MRHVAGLLVLLAALCWGGKPADAGSQEAIEAYAKKDYAEALRACRDAAQAGDAICQTMLGKLYAEGWGVGRDPAEAARWFRRAAEQGDAFAALNLGSAYEHGSGVRKDLDEAEKWYRQAAEKGLAGAQFSLGRLLLEADRDLKQAVKWFRPAAAQGLPPAQYALGLLYENGKGVRRNYRLAVKWYEAAADHGIAPAQSRLARLYEEGLGVESDLEEAYFWYRAALANADDPAHKDDQKALKRVAAQLSKSQIAAAEEAVREWRPQAVEIGKPRSRRQARKRDQGPELYATGSGFFVTGAGHLVTNNHVVEHCGEMRITEGDSSVPAKLLATDPDRDLALLQIDHPTQAALFRSEPKPRPGENIVVIGFPLAGLLTSDPIVTTGIISALAGLHNDRRQIQISAPVQPGNSGGPVLDASGHIVGIVVAKLDAVGVAKVIGTLPENVNFAINAEEAKSFLAAHDVTIAATPPGQDLGSASVAEAALKVTVRVECWK